MEGDIQAAIAEHGIRNALLTSVAPTGTISLFADNVSSGLEPVFSFKHARAILMPDGKREDEEVSDYAYRLYRRIKGDGARGRRLRRCPRLSPKDHRSCRRCRNISTVPFPRPSIVPKPSSEDFKDVYARAYDMGCKGCHLPAERCDRLGPGRQGRAKRKRRSRRFLISAPTRNRGNFQGGRGDPASTLPAPDRPLDFAAGKGASKAKRTRRMARPLFSFLAITPESVTHGPDGRGRDQGDALPAPTSAKMVPRLGGDFSHCWRAARKRAKLSSPPGNPNLSQRSLY